MTGDGSPALLVIDELSVEYRVASAPAPLRAVDGVSLSIGRGETYGLIGESGSGKSTVARAVMRLAPVAKGNITVEGERFDQLRGRALRRARRRVGMVFQDPHDALDPRMTVHQAVAEPLRLDPAGAPADLDGRVKDLLARVGLGTHLLERRPGQLSGGQKQRVNIARALAVEPSLLICDEAVSALDLSVQAGILNLLVDLQRDLGLSYLFISHDLGVVAHMADRVGVMYLGQLVETGAATDLVTAPGHPYTEALLSAEPRALPSRLRTRQRIVLEGDVPSPFTPPSGCRFRTRCRYAVDRCIEEEPPLRSVSGDRLVACHRFEELQGSRRPDLS